ncbi:hypothetical protein Mapa_003438 [Marchantia paleacea]|nr:hypothetical protein Mapa_003438 [Marchantia paleacea]
MSGILRSSGASSLGGSGDGGCRLESSRDGAALGELVMGNGSLYLYLDKNSLEQGRRERFIMWQYAVLEVNALLWTLLIVVTMILVRRMLGIITLWARAWKLPGPPPQFFMRLSRSFGNDSGPDSFTECFGALHKEYGPVVRVWLGPTQLVVSVKDLSMVKELLIQAKDRVPATRKAFQLAFGKDSLFFSSYSQAKRRRSVLQQEFCGSLLRNVHGTCLNVVDDLKSWAYLGVNGKEVDAKVVSQHMSIAVLGMSIFGEGFKSWGAAEEFEKILVKVSQEACMWARFRVAPIWKKEFRNYQKMCSRLRDLMEDLITLSRSMSSQGSMRGCYLETIDAMWASRSNRNDRSASETAEGILNEFLSELGASQHSHPGPVNSLKKFNPHLLSLFCHACFATSGIISGVLTRLGQHPDVQAKIYQEIIDTCGEDECPKVEDLKKMHYLWATLHESARLLPISPILQRSSLEKDVKLGQGMVLPAGAILVVPVQLLQMDSNSWGQDVDTFNPNRFLKPSKASVDDANMNQEASGEESTTDSEASGLQDHWEVVSPSETKGTKQELEDLIFDDPDEDASFLLFGAGSRVCVGKDFVMRTMVTILACLIQQFEIKLASQSDENLRPKLENFVLQLSPSPSLVFLPRG